MDSDESRPGSSASNSSSNSSESKSAPSSPAQSPRVDEDCGPKSPPANSIASPGSPSGRRSGAQSRSSQVDNASPRSNAKSRSGSRSRSESGSSSSDGSSSGEEDADEAAKGGADREASSRSSSEEPEEAVSVNKSSHDSKDAPSPGSIRSPSNSRGPSNFDGENEVANSVNISHEDLSDVSDMESEKRDSSVNNSKEMNEDEVTNVSEFTNPNNENDAESNQKGARRFSIDESVSQDATLNDLRQKLDQKKMELNEMDVAQSNENGSPKIGGCLDDLVKTNDEDALDFEAEEGECLDVSKEEAKDKSGTEADGEAEKKDAEEAAENKEELEEGEVTDEDEKRPEETEPKPVCRFYTRGQCTWGMSCRFLHPGVTDKGNYTMFDLVRPVPMPGGRGGHGYMGHGADYPDYRTERSGMHHRAPLHHPSATIYPPHHDPRAIVPETPVVLESAWERGLRTAKEMMRKANKRKEQDMDFEDKKMNLTLSPEELEKEAYYLKERGSPTDIVPPYSRHPMYHDIPPAAAMYSPPDRFGRGGPLPYDDIDSYGRTTRYRELPPHRMPHYEDERRVRPTREVIVQRVEHVGRGDEWNDPWMRTKSPGARGGSREHGDKRRRDRRSYSSNSSYSTSSSSQSDSSSDSSGSASPVDQRRRYNNSAHKSPSRRHAMRSLRSPSPPIRRARRSPTLENQSVEFKESRVNPFKDHHENVNAFSGGIRRPSRSHMMSPQTAANRRNAGMYSPVMKRKKMSSVPDKSLSSKNKLRHRHSSSSSGSDSSDTSASDSDSESGSSSSESSSRSRTGRTPPRRGRMPEKPVMDAKSGRKEPPKRRSPISIEIKKPNAMGASALASSPPHRSGSSERESSKSKSRREELLKQLRAVEDAIAKKRQRLN